MGEFKILVQHWYPILKKGEGLLMNLYNRLNVNEREELSRMLAMNYSLRSIARAIQRAPSTLSREISRNVTDRQLYRAMPSENRAARLTHKKRKPRKLSVNFKLRCTVFKLLAQRWSPEQIAHHLLRCYPNKPDMQISHEAIYTYLYVLPRGSLKKELIAFLRQRHNVRRPRSRKRLKPNPIQDIISIEERPQEVADRTVPGHWEGDLLVGAGNASALGTLVERVTRFTILVPLKAKNAASVRKAFARELKSLPLALKQTLTYDQGQEMREHRLFTKQTKIKVFFAHPHSPWERGTNENTNGLVRQFFPSGTDFNKISRREIKQVQNLLNGRPRKTLNWCMPSDVFSGLLH